MFAKLLKYEWKANGKKLGIFSLAAVGISILAAVVLRLLVGNLSGYDGENEELLLLLTPVLTMLMVFLVLALVVYGAMTQFLLLHRFYKNKFTDEGYLTFTLPVTAHEIFLSSWLNMLIWSVISTAVVLLSVAVIALFGTAEQGIVNSELISGLSELFTYSGGYYEELFGTGYSVLLALTQIVQFLTGPVIMMSCVTIGAVAAKKHKILMAVAIYYIYTMVMSMGGSVVEGFSLMAEYQYGTDIYVYVSAAGELILTLTVAAVGYFLSTHFMKNKLNLP